MAVLKALIPVESTIARFDSWGTGNDHHCFENHLWTILVNGRVRYDCNTAPHDCDCITSNGKAFVSAIYYPTAFRLSLVAGRRF